MKIKDKTVLITGANRGIGAALVHAFRKAGARKIYAGMRTVEAIGDPAIEAVGLDITKDEQVSAAAAHCDDVNILVNNAGIAAFVPFLASDTTSHARAEMEINYFGTLSMCRAFAYILKRNGGGALVNVLSTASWIGAPMHGSYCASKAAEWALTNAIRFELKSQRTLVSGVFVGYVETDMTAGIETEKVTPEYVGGQIVCGIERGDEEILVDERARMLRGQLLNDYGPLNKEMQERWDRMEQAARANR